MRLKVAQSMTTIETLEQRITSQEREIESLRQQLALANKSGPQENEGPWKAIEKQLTAMRSAQNQLQADIRQLQGHANETTVAMDQYRKRIDGVQEHVEKNVGQLKGAVQSLVAAVEPSHAAPSPDGTYTVKSGDTLGTIAQRHGTSISQLRDLNQLKGDRIVIGQKLKLP
jgi:LysM repeat protein